MEEAIDTPCYTILQHLLRIHMCIIVHFQFIFFITSYDAPHAVDSINFERSIFEISKLNGIWLYRLYRLICLEGEKNKNWFALGAIHQPEWWWCIAGTPIGVMMNAWLNDGRKPVTAH